MNIFKLYLRLFFKSALGISLMYMMVFLFVSSVFLSSGGSSSSTSFEAFKCRTAVLNNDNSTVASELEKYIKDNTTPVELTSYDNDSIKDSIFARYVMYVLIIPEGYGERFATDDELKLGVYSVPDAASAALVDQMVNNFLITAELYKKGTGEIDFTKVRSDLSIESDVVMSNNYQSSKNSVTEQAITFMAYPILAIVLFATCHVIITLQHTDIKRRINCSPAKSLNVSLQVYLGAFIVALVVFAVMVVFMFAVYSEDITSYTAPFYFLNLFVFVLVALSIAVFVAGFGKFSVIMPVSNIVSLSCSFLGGIFVPLELLSESVLRIAVINPAFWYAKANGIISGITASNPAVPSELFVCIVVELLFAVAFFAMSLVVTRIKRSK